MASELSAALAKLQSQLPHIGKDANGIVREGRRLKYADLADVTKAIMPLMGKLGLSFTCQPTMIDGQFVLDYQLRHEGGEAIEGYYPLGTGSPQQIGSAITYARRYCLCAVTGVAPDDDDDDAAAAEGAPRQQQQNGRVRTAHSDPEHTRLREPPVEDYGRSQRTRGPVPADADRWDAQPAGDTAPPAPEDRQGGMDGRQQSRMFALFAEIGMAGKDDAQRMWLSSALGRPVESRKSLTWAEADKAGKVLAEQAAVAKLPGSAGPEQVGAVASLYASKLGFKRAEKEQMLVVSEQVIGRSLDGPDGKTHRNLSVVEARKLHDTLGGFADRAALEDWLKSPAEVSA